MSEEVQQLVLWLIPVAPLLAAVVTALLGPKLLRGKSHLPCWSALAVSFVCSLILLVKILPAAPASESHVATITYPLLSEIQNMSIRFYLFGYIVQREKVLAKSKRILENFQSFDKIQILLLGRRLRLIWKGLR